MVLVLELLLLDHSYPVGTVGPGPSTGGWLAGGGGGHAYPTAPVTGGSGGAGGGGTGSTGPTSNQE